MTLETSVKGLMSKIDNGITVVAATKMQTIETIRQLPKLGIQIVAENRVQELIEKYQPVEGLSWHFIGQLQTNKVKAIVDKVSCIQSVDRIRLAEVINDECAKINKSMEILVEVKSDSGNDAKGGVEVRSAALFIDELAKFRFLKVVGIMTVMPVSCCEDDYKEIKKLYDGLVARFPLLEWKYLSMGMSNDYEVAIKCGANMIRIGSALFGERK